MERLSYIKCVGCSKSLLTLILFSFVGQAGFEPATRGLEVLK